jgi:branched-chain amino acid transport system permease protein
VPDSDATAMSIVDPGRVGGLLRRRDRDLPEVYYRRDYLRITAFVAFVIVVRLTIVHGQSTQNSVNLWLLYAVVALGFYLVFGIAGRFAFSQTFMMALGGYVSAWASTHHAMWLAFLLSLLASAVIGLVFALILIRANEFYFGIATLAIAGIGTIVFQNWDSFTGPSGLRYNIPAIGFDGHLANSEKQVFWVFLALLVVALVVASLIERSALRRRYDGRRSRHATRRSSRRPLGSRSQ